jgi:hypothetical protein
MKKQFQLHFNFSLKIEKGPYCKNTFFIIKIDQLDTRLPRKAD